MKSSKLSFSASVAARLPNGVNVNRRVSVPALPYRGQWAVAKIGDMASITFAPTGEMICYCPSRLRVGRVICAILDRLGDIYDFGTRKGQRRFREQRPELFEWIKEVDQ